MYRLSDFCIGDFPLSEHFGANPAIYNARYGLQGYPGIRIKMPTLTPILSVAPGFVLEVGMEEAGKGKFITIVHDGFLTTYGHLNDILVQKDEKVIGGQLIAHSNQSGLAEYPCLYFGIAPCDGSGTKTDQNGYDGYIDPLDTNRIEWDIKSPTTPTTKADILDKMTLSSQEYAILNAQATNYKVIISFLQQQTEFDNFLKERGHAPINLEQVPDDSSGGQAVTMYLTTIADEFEEMNAEITKLTQKEPEVPVEQPVMPLVKKESHLVRFLHRVKKFVFTS